MTDLEELKRKIIPILRRYDVKKASIFGSFLRDDYRIDSDIDILVELEDSINLFDFIGLKQEIEDTVGRNIDLVEFSMIKPVLKQRIMKEQVAII